MTDEEKKIKEDFERLVGELLEEVNKPKKEEIWYMTRAQYKNFSDAFEEVYGKNKSK